MSNNVRNELNRLAQQIENLAQQVQNQIASGTNSGGLLSTINEVVRNSSTLTFAYGELCALEETGSGKSRKVTVVSNPNGTKTVNKNFYNVRDSLGRFARV